MLTKEKMFEYSLAVIKKECVFNESNQELLDNSFNVLEYALKLLKILKEKCVDLATIEFILENERAARTEQEYNKFTESLPELTQEDFQEIVTWLSLGNSKVKRKAANEKFH